MGKSQGRKYLIGTNTLAYICLSVRDEEESDSRCRCYKTFIIRRNKLECFFISVGNLLCRQSPGRIRLTFKKFSDKRPSLFSSSVSDKKVL